MESKEKTILSYLESSFLFRGLKSPQIQTLAKKTKFQTYHRGQILIEQDFISDKIILIVSGLVKIYELNSDGKEIFIAIEKNGDYLGVMNLEDQPGHATIEALQSTRVLAFHKKDLLLLLRENPLLWERLYRITLAKLNEFRQLHSVRLGNDLYQRTYLLLKFLSQFSTNNTVVLSQESIAHIVGATRPRVTETLHMLQDKKLIGISSKKISILKL